MSLIHRQKSRPRATAAVLAAACLAVPGTAGAQTFWNAGAGDGLWATPTNWSTGATPTSDDLVGLGDLPPGSPGDPQNIDLGAGASARALFVNDGAVNQVAGQTTNYVYTLSGGPLSLFAGATGVRAFSKDRSLTINSDIISATAGQPLATYHFNGGVGVGATSALTLNGDLTAVQITYDSDGKIIYNGDNSGVQKFTFNGSDPTVGSIAAGILGSATALGAGNVQFNSNSGNARQTSHTVGLTSDVVLPGKMRFGRFGNQPAGSMVTLRVESGDTDRTLTVEGAELFGESALSGAITTELASGGGGVNSGFTSTYALGANGSGDAGNITLKLTATAIDSLYQARTTTVAGSTVEWSPSANRTIFANLGGINGGISANPGGDVSGGGRVVKSGAGTVELGFVLSQTGGTHINEGTLKLVSFSSGAAGTVTGQLPDTGTVQIAGGTLDLNGNTETIGSAIVDGSSTSTIATGAGGSLVVPGGLTVNSGATAQVTTGATGSLNASGLTLNGTAKLDITNSRSVIITGGDPAAIRAAIISGRGGAGGTATWTGNGITSSLAAATPITRAVGYTTSGGNVTLAYVVAGDANLSGSVDGSDFNIWNANRFQPGEWEDADFNYTGDVDGSDFNIWNANRFQTIEAAHVVAAATLTASSATENVPLFIYDPGDGVLHMDTNQSGTDKLVSFLVTSPPALEILKFKDGTFDEGNGWAQQFFNGREQWIATFGNGVAGAWDIARFATGLDLSSFGEVEYGVRRADGTGFTGFTEVTLVPEPAALGLLAMSGLALLARRRRIA